MKQPTLISADLCVLTSTSEYPESSGFCCPRKYFTIGPNCQKTFLLRVNNLLSIVFTIPVNTTHLDLVSATISHWQVQLCAKFNPKKYFIIICNHIWFFYRGLALFSLTLLFVNDDFPVFVIQTLQIRRPRSWKGIYIKEWFPRPSRRCTRP